MNLVDYACRLIGSDCAISRQTSFIQVTIGKKAGTLCRGSLEENAQEEQHVACLKPL